MNITISELLEKIRQEKINIIDIRSKYDYSLGHIESAKNISPNYLLTSPEQYLNKTEFYYIYCQYGNISKRMVTYLNNRGYKVINISGGYNDYQKQKSS